MKSVQSVDTLSVLKLSKKGKLVLKIEGPITDVDVKYWTTRPLLDYDKITLNGKDITNEYED